MSIDIESPGASEARLKTAISDLVGFIAIATGEIAIATEYVYVDIPAACGMVQIEIQNFQISPGSYFLFALSDDDGATWYKDEVTYVGYNILGASTSNGSTIAGSQYTDGYGDIAGGNMGSLLMSGSIRIFPGGNGSPATVETAIVANDGTNISSRRVLNLFTTNTNRMNKIRLCSLEGHDFVKGTYQAFGTAVS